MHDPLRENILIGVKKTGAGLAYTAFGADSVNLSTAPSDGVTPKSYVHAVRPGWAKWALVRFKLTGTDVTAAVQCALYTMDNDVDKAWRAERNGHITLSNSNTREWAFLPVADIQRLACAILSFTDAGGSAVLDVHVTWLESVSTLIPLYNGTVTLCSGVTAANKAAFNGVDLTANPSSGTIPAAGATAIRANAKTAIVDIALSSGDADTLILVRALKRRRTLGTWVDALELPVMCVTTSQTTSRINIPCADADAIFVMVDTYSDAGATASLAAYVYQSEAVLRATRRRVKLPLAIEKDAAYSPTLDDSTTFPLPPNTREAWLEFYTDNASAAVTGEVWPRYAGTQSHGVAARYSQTNIQSLTDRRWYVRLDDAGGGGFDRVGIKLPVVTSPAKVSVYLILILEDE